MTSPFLLANRPQGSSLPPPTSAPQTAYVDPATLDPRSAWERKRDELAATAKKQQEDQAISPVAGTIPDSEYLNRFTAIRAIGENAAQGQIQSSAYQAQMEQQRQANALAAAQQKALQAAYANAGKFDFGSYPQGTYSTSPGALGGAQIQYDGSQASIADMMRKAGFPESQIGIGLGVIQAESSFNKDATHLNSNGSTDQGLFQINTIHHDKYAGQNIFDPQTNVNIAYQVWKEAGGNWSPWVTYQQGLAHALPVPPSRVTAYPSWSGGPVTTPTGGLRMQAVQKSLVVLNLPYVWGGDSLQTGVDCSGLVQQVYKQVGISVPRTADEQSHTAGVRVGSINQLQPGDLVAFQWAGGYRGAGSVSHIAIYAGHGQIIEAYGGDHGRRRSLTNSQQDQGAIFIHVKFPGE